jgi:hypothetical protein
MEGDSERNASAGRPATDPSLAKIVVARLAAIEAGQNAMNGALGLMLDTLQVQTNLLRKLNEYATEEPAPSPVAKLLGELASAIMELDASIGGMEKKFDRLSDIIAAAYDLEPTNKSSPTINGKA